MTDTPANDARTRRGSERSPCAETLSRRTAVPMYGLAAIMARHWACLTVLLFSIVSAGLPAFTTTQVALNLNFDAGDIDPGWIDAIRQSWPMAIIAEHF